MDRQIVYPGAIPLETDLLNTNKNAMIGLSKLAAAILGTSTFLNGLACTPNSPADLTVKVAPGEIYSLQNIDGTAYSSIAADTTHAILKQGIMLDQATLACPAPVTAGQSVNYLIQVAYQDTDANAVVLPYYNSSNPSQAYAGPANAGTAQNTVRKGVCAVSAKAGIAATTGTQTTPAPDAGYTGAFVVTVAYGQTQINAGNISTYGGAPFLPSAGLVVGGLQGNACNISSAGGTADAITGSYTPGITALTNGMTLYVRAGSANATTTPTFTPNSGTIAAKTIVKGAGSALAAGDIAGGGHWIELQYDATLDKWVLLNPATGVAVVSSVPRSYLAGLTLSTAGSSASMGVAAGMAADSTNTVMLALAAAITKTTSAWAVGTGNGGLDTGAIANSTWYYWYLIRRPDTGVTDIIFSLSPTSPALPTNYTQYRYIGAGLTNGSGQWVKFKQVGDEFYWDTPVMDFNGAGAATASLLTCSVPRGRKVKGEFVVKASGLGNVANGTYLSDPDNADLAPSQSAVPLYTVEASGNAANTYEIVGRAACWTDTSARIRHRESTTNTLQIQTLGWTDLRGKND